MRSCQPFECEELKAFTLLVTLLVSIFTHRYSEGDIDKTFAELDGPDDDGKISYTDFVKLAELPVRLRHMLDPLVLSVADGWPVSAHGHLLHRCYILCQQSESLVGTSYNMKLTWTSIKTDNPFKYYEQINAPALGEGMTGKVYQIKHKTSGKVYAGKRVRIGRGADSKVCGECAHLHWQFLWPLGFTVFLFFCSLLLALPTNDLFVVAFAVRSSFPGVCRHNS